MAITRTDFVTSSNKDLLKKGTLRKLHDDTVRQRASHYKTMYNDLQTDLMIVRDEQMAGFYRTQEIAEGQNIPIQAPIEGEQKEYTQRQFASGFRMTHKFKIFNQYGLWKRWAKQIGEIQVDTKDVELAVPYNSPTSTTLTCGKGFDSLALASNTHLGMNPNITSDNFNNYLNVDLSFTGIQSARYYFKMAKDQMGNWMGLKGDTLYFEPTLWWTANELVGSSKKPHEFSNTTNLIPEMGLSLFEYPRLTSTNKWGMLDKGSQHFDMNCFTARSPKMYFKDAPDNTLDSIALTIQYFTYGWGNPKCVLVGK